ncbi:ABC transporter substrate-binding protein [Paenibacillus sp. GSMTC-2017]|uniref:stalk domain-containing protein n=1 Tax=Paenibacillus sp. GSMTC-2017 TaxID=2794350 RepID=UPI0018D9C26B|nr:stalk domain-containing protein [Paenibacillus sp. GSMTC-2017]MBH5319222.1 ABC transporter substrate-binding protein [Paenibacillus sp. GSMTC-2017]
MINRKKVLSFVLSLALIVSLVPATAATAAAKKINVTIDGKGQKFDVSPKIVNGRTMVPYRAIAEALGGKVKFDVKTKKATIVKGKQTVELTQGSKNAKINGAAATLEAAPVNEKGSLLVPLRFVGESLGVWVNWNNSSSTAVLETKRSFKHEFGTAQLNGVPKRVVVLYNGAVDTSVMLGIKPVGAVESIVQQPFYEYIRPQLKGVKVLGDEAQPNLEAIVALKPDVIIASKWRHEKIYAQLSKIAPTVVTKEFTDWQESVDVISKVTNKEDVAAKFMASWKTNVADFKKKISAKDLNSTISIIRVNPNGSARAYYSGFAFLIFKELGFKSPAAQTKFAKEKETDIIPVTSTEQIGLLDGDYIFDFTTDWEGDGAIYQHQKTWTSSELWKNLKGVKAGNYYKVNAVTWNLSAGPLAAQRMLDDLYFYFGLE